MTIKTHYSAPELAEMNLIGLPKYPQKINARAKKESWVGRQRKVGKGLEYEVKLLPVHIREQIKEHVIGKLVEASPAKKVIVAENQTVIMLETVRRCPAVLEKKLADLNTEQRACAEARCALVQEVLKLETEGKMRRLPAIKFIIEKSNRDDLPEALMEQVRLANNKRGNDRTLGIRSLNEWVLIYMKANDSVERLLALAPKRRKQKQPEQAPWFLRFMKHWRNPNGVSRVEAYEDFCAEWAVEFSDQPAMMKALPSLDAVRRMLKKLPKKTLR